MEGRDHAGDTGLLAERGVPDEIAEEADPRQGQAADREGVAQRDPEDRVEVGRGLRPARVQMWIPADDPHRGRVESEVEQPVPDGEESAERSVLQVDVVPAVEEKPGHEQNGQQAGG